MTVSNMYKAMFLTLFFILPFQLSIAYADELKDKKKSAGIEITARCCAFGRGHCPNDDQNCATRVKCKCTGQYNTECSECTPVN